MSDLGTRALERASTTSGQPECARLLVAIGRADRRPEGVRVLVPLVGWVRVRAIYPLWDRSGWCCLLEGPSGVRVEDVEGVHRG